MILAYQQERFPLTFFGPLALILAICAVGRASGVALATATLGAGLLLAQFRIWDDIADRRADTVLHPDRVLVRATDITPLVALGVAVMAGNLAVTQRYTTSASLVTLAALHLVLGSYYFLRHGRTVWGDQLLLSKYPAFVAVLAGDRLLTSPLPVALTAALVYAAASAYEAWHDPVSPLAQLIGGRS